MLTQLPWDKMQGCLPPFPLPIQPHSFLHTPLYQCVPHLRTFAHVVHLPVFTHPARTLPPLTSSHPNMVFHLLTEMPPTAWKGAAPPAVCTAPWRPPAQPESPGSLPPAGPPGSAGPAAAAPPHLPMGRGEKLQGQELAVRTSLPSPETPEPLPCQRFP